MITGIMAISSVVGPALVAVPSRVIQAGTPASGGPTAMTATVLGRRMRP